jgi:hypothetical protein
MPFLIASISFLLFIPGDDRPVFLGKGVCIAHEKLFRENVLGVGN